MQPNNIAAAAMAMLAGMAVQQAFADTPVPCSGDDRACQALTIVQHGTNPDTGAHFVMFFTPYPGQPPQNMMLTLWIAESNDKCSSAAETSANLNLDQSRSIDGYLCRLRATWERN